MSVNPHLVHLEKYAGRVCVQTVIIRLCAWTKVFGSIEGASLLTCCGVKITIRSVFVVCSVIWIIFIKFLNDLRLEISISKFTFQKLVHLCDIFLNQRGVVRTQQEFVELGVVFLVGSIRNAWVVDDVRVFGAVLVQALIVKRIQCNWICDETRVEDRVETQNFHCSAFKDKIIKYFAASQAVKSRE